MTNKETGPYPRDGRHLFFLLLVLPLTSSSPVRADRVYDVPRPPNTSYEARILVDRGGRFLTRAPCSEPKAYAFLLRQLARIDTVSVGDRVVLHMSDGRDRDADRDLGDRGFFDLDPKLTVYVAIDVALTRATLGLIYRDADRSVCSEKWSGPVTLERR